MFYYKIVSTVTHVADSRWLAALVPTGLWYISCPRPHRYDVPFCSFLCIWCEFHTVICTTCTLCDTVPEESTVVCRRLKWTQSCLFQLPLINNLRSTFIFNFGIFCVVVFILVERMSNFRQWTWLYRQDAFLSDLTIAKNYLNLWKNKAGRA